MKAGSHIISRFNWNTSFDRKDKAFELQERISSWSKTNMQREITNIFGKICPPEQIWRIHSLELDLGEVDYNNLEPELTIRLRKILHQKLIDLVIYGRSADHQIEILNEDTSHVQMLNSFLLTGVMPWTYRPSFGSVNELLAQQLRQNRPKLIHMIRETGSQYDYVRKRMAWQFTEINLVRTIEGLEPNHHEQVVNFSNELNRIQAREMIVQSDSNDFRKNLWHWILNHLLTERGTIFNKVSFIKSSIVQMAAHYNISYHELLKIIERAVRLLSRYDNRRGSLIHTLVILLSDGRETVAGIKRSEEDPAVFWKAAENAFLQPALRSNIAQKNKFNELVLSLSHMGPERMCVMLRSFERSESFWKSVIKDLNTAALEAVAQVLIPAQADAFVALINSLANITTKDKNSTWCTGILFILNSSKDFNRKRLIDAFVKDHMKRNNRSEIEAISWMIAQQQQVNERNITASEVLIDLKQMFSKALNKTGLAIIESHIESLLSLKEAERGGILHFEIIRKYFTKDAAGTFDLLLRCEHKTGLEKWLPYLVNAETAERVIKRSKTELCVFLADLRGILGDVKNAQVSTSFKMSMMESMTVAGIHAMILKPSITRSEIMKEILEKWTAEFSGAHQQAYFHIVDTFLSGGKLETLKVPAAGIEKLRNRYLNEENRDMMRMVSRTMAVSVNNKPQAAALLLSGIGKKSFAWLGENNPEERKEIMNYLLSGSADIMHSMVRHYAQLVADRVKTVTLRKLEEILEELYWRTLLGFAAHRGNMETFQQIFGQAVVYRFPLISTLRATKGWPVKMPDSHIIPEKSNPETYPEIKEKYSGERYLKLAGEKHLVPGNEKETETPGIFECGRVKALTIEVIGTLIKNCLKKGKRVAIIGQQRFALGELIIIGFRKDAPNMRRLIAQFPFSERLVKQMKNALGFYEFSEWMAHGAGPEMREKLFALRSLAEILYRMDDPHLLPRGEKMFYRQTWSLLQDPAVSTAQWTKTTGEMLCRMLAQRKADPIMLNKAIDKSEAALTPVLCELLSFCLPRVTVKHTPNLLVRYENAGLLHELGVHLVHLQQMPAWHTGGNDLDTGVYLRAFIERYPSAFLAVTRQQPLSVSALLHLNRSVPMAVLIKAAAKLNMHQQPVLNLFEKLYEVFTKMKTAFMPVKEISCILQEKLLTAWIHGNWRILESAQIWNELVWEICAKRKISRKVFLLEMEKNKNLFPPAIQLTLEHMLQDVHYAKTAGSLAVLKHTKIQLPVLKTGQSKLQKTGIGIKNAGLVLVSSYVNMLFERLGLLKDRKFMNDIAQTNAVHYLQYVVTGLCKTEESLLALNKILCGLPLHQPVQDSIDITEEQKKLIDGMVSAAISHWPSVGDSSVNGFRGNWLVRDGLLTEHEDKWELTVEKRAYDILIHKSPFSFSIIKFPWMDKPLHVNWPY